MNYLDAVTDFIFIEDAPVPSDIIFIPGNSSPQPSEHAAYLYNEGFAPLILPSGRFSITNGSFQEPSEKKDLYPENFQTEWEFMNTVLHKNGVPKEAVLKEDKAQYTYQNALNSKEVLRRNHIEIRRAILCCKPYHARRCLMYYAMVFPEVSFSVCPAPGMAVTRENWQTSRAGLKEVLGELERCGSQFSFMLSGQDSPVLPTRLTPHSSDSSDTPDSSDSSETPEITSSKRP